MKGDIEIDKEKNMVKGRRKVNPNSSYCLKLIQGEKLTM